jgi:hypothetical protein
MVKVILWVPFTYATHVLVDLFKQNAR